MDALLAELEPLLYGYNYQVFLRAYRMPFAPGKPAESYIAQALGPSAVIGGVVPVSGREIVSRPCWLSWSRRSRGPNCWPGSGCGTGTRRIRCSGASRSSSRAPRAGWC